jgi:hypothetical protein
VDFKDIDISLKFGEVLLYVEYTNTLTWNGRKGKKTYVYSMYVAIGKVSPGKNIGIFLHHPIV